MNCYGNDVIALELKHVWATEKGRVSYRTTSGTGFERISIRVSDIESIIAKLNGSSASTDSLRHFDALLDTNAAMVLDPDGYLVRVVEAS